MTENSTTQHNDRRQSVSEDYARAVENPSSSSCCAPVPKGVVAKLADYTAEEMAALPSEAVVNSFGCGNPVAFSDVEPGDVVLDLGSGAGIDLLLAAEKVGPQGKVIGVDMTDAMIEKARKNVAEAGLENVEVRKGIIEDLPVEDGSVDWVISNCVINLSPEKSKVFAEIVRALSPGGRILVSDIVAEELPQEILENQRLYSTCLAGAIGGGRLPGWPEAGRAGRGGGEGSTGLRGSPDRSLYQLRTAGRRRGVLRWGKGGGGVCQALGPTAIREGGQRESGGTEAVNFPVDRGRIFRRCPFGFCSLPAAPVSPSARGWGDELPRVGLRSSKRNRISGTCAALQGRESATGCHVAALPWINSPPQGR